MKTREKFDLQEEADVEPERRETWYEYRSENDTLVRAGIITTSYSHWRLR